MILITKTSDQTCVCVCVYIYHITGYSGLVILLILIVIRCCLYPHWSSLITLILILIGGINGETCYDCLYRMYVSFKISYQYRAKLSVRYSHDVLRLCHVFFTRIWQLAWRDSSRSRGKLAPCARIGMRTLPARAMTSSASLLQKESRSARATTT